LWVVRRGAVFQFGDFTLDVVDRRLLHRSRPVRVSPKSFDLLVELVRADGRMITKRDLLARVWPDVFVEEGILTVHVSALRKALGANAAAWIETVRGAGYRFVGAASRWRFTTADVGTAPCSGAVRTLVATGRARFLTGSSEQMPGALEAFREALAIDPTCASAHAGFALTRCAQAYLRAVPHADAYAEAKVAALRALAMDSESADAQAALGTVLFLSEWDWAAARRSLERALVIDPGHAEALLQCGALHDALGDLDRGLALKRTALARAPSSPLVFMELAVSLSLQRRFGEALASARQALAFDSTNQRATEFVTLTCLLIDDVRGYAAERRRHAEAFDLPDDARAAMERRLLALEETHARGGKVAVRRWLLQTMPKGGDSRASLQRAGLHAALGDLDAAFAHLECAIPARDPMLVYLAVHALWDPLRGDGRLACLLSRLGLPIIAAAAAS
jgi:DNA-binding winged helix-turn-helix (wHTH) protein